MNGRNGNGSPAWRVVGMMLAAVFVALAARAATDNVSALKNHDFKQAIDISADRLEVRTKENKAVFEGGVDAVQGDLTLKADRVVVLYQSKKPLGSGNSAPTISRIDATGGVHLISPSEAVDSQWGVYDLESRLITLGGSVVLHRGEVTVEGDRLLVDLKTGVTKLETADTGSGETGGKGRVRGRFVPADGDGK